jgi:hypothetical protein
VGERQWGHDGRGAQQRARRDEDLQDGPDQV